jgi:hypothetical protein
MGNFMSILMACFGKKTDNLNSDAINDAKLQSTVSNNLLQQKQKQIKQLLVQLNMILTEDQKTKLKLTDDQKTKMKLTDDQKTKLKLTDDQKTKLKEIDDEKLELKKIDGEKLKLMEDQMDQVIGFLLVAHDQLELTLQQEQKLVLIAQDQLELMLQQELQLVLNQQLVNLLNQFLLMQLRDSEQRLNEYGVGELGLKLHGIGLKLDEYGLEELGQLGQLFLLDPKTNRVLLHLNDSALLEFQNNQLLQLQLQVLVEENQLQQLQVQLYQHQRVLDKALIDDGNILISSYSKLRIDNQVVKFFLQLLYLRQLNNTPEFIKPQTILELMVIHLLPLRNIYRQLQQLREELEILHSVA